MIPSRESDAGPDTRESIKDWRDRLEDASDYLRECSRSCTLTLAGDRKNRRDLIELAEECLALAKKDLESADGKP